MICKLPLMPTEVAFPHIAKSRGEPARLKSHPRTRVAMIVADYLWRGWSAEETVRQYPHLTLAEVHAALAYYHDHRDEIESELAAEYRDTEAWKKAHPTPVFLARFKETSGALQSIVDEAFRASPEGGEIDLEYLQKTLKVDRHTLLEHTRILGKPYVLVTGRRGAKSRLAWANKVPPYLTQAKRRRQKLEVAARESKSR